MIDCLILINNSENKNKNNAKIKIKSNFRISLFGPKRIDQKAVLDGFLQKLSNKKAPNEIKLPVGPVFWEGWLKYFKYTNGAKAMRPMNFFLNQMYSNQKVLRSELKKKDEFGFLHVTTPFQFYAKVINDRMNILNSREIETTRNVDTLHIGVIQHIDVNKRYDGGVTDMGHFSEGHCLQVITNGPHIPNEQFDVDKETGVRNNWIICTDSKPEKEKLLEILLNLKLLQQKKDDAEREKNKKNITSLSSLKKAMQNGPTVDKSGSQSILDGYWLMLSDWSQCTLKCGGGKSYQQWMCVPPKTGGKPCNGKSIREKDCNKIPCPNTGGFPGVGKVTNLHEVAKPIIKSLPFSTRPQKYIKCELKEKDVFYKIKDSDGKLVNAPSRIIMNNRTISLFRDDDYKESVFAFYLKDTAIDYHKEDECCFDLASGKKKYTICGGFGTRCGTKNDQIFVNEWMLDFDLFKNKCFNRFVHKNWKSTMIKKKEQEKLNQARLGNIENRAKLIHKKLREKENLSMLSKIKKTQNLAMKALKRELNIERMLAREEQLKSEAEAKRLLELKKQEKKKEDCLDKAFKERDLQDRRLREKKEADNQIKKIKDEAIKDVEDQRRELKRKIDDIRNRANRRKRLIEQEISVIRGNMAKKLVDAQRNGDMELCKQSTISQTKIENYCNFHVITDYVRNLDCKNPDSFCYICCETEFGNMFMKNRDLCYAMCDDLMRQKINGKWIWTKIGDKK